MHKRNLWVVPTDKPSRLVLSNNSILTVIGESNYNFSHIKSVHIYITSDEKFIRDEYITDGIEVIKATPKLVDAQGLVDRRDWKKIIASNSPTLTPNSYIHEDRVKEFVEYWNKWKELPKFKKIVPAEDGQFRPSGVFLIKWLPKEEERERGITITSLSRKIDNCRHFDKEIGCVKNDCSCEKESTKEINIEQIAKEYLQSCKPKKVIGGMTIGREYRPTSLDVLNGVVHGYNIAKNIHQQGMFTEDEIIAFAEWLNKNATTISTDYWDYNFQPKTSKELLEIFLNQQNGK